MYILTVSHDVTRRRLSHLEIFRPVSEVLEIKRKTVLNEEKLLKNKNSTLNKHKTIDLIV